MPRGAPGFRETQFEDHRCKLRLIECSQIPMVRPLLVKERAESGFNASRTVILTSKTSMAFGGTSSA
ncbi:hypothetical protein TNCV_1215011 [Trichonephila clavipes]|nr:hypothetical protein TNCV_1215011 [Trichonephila clavipes]